MKVRIVCSGTVPNFNFEIHQAFIYDQVESIKRLDKSITFEYFFISKGGFSGYFNAWKLLLAEQKRNPCDVIHAHGGLAAFISVMQFKEPVISTFHGSDINLPKSRVISGIAASLSRASIFVSKGLKKKALFKGNATVIPCGVDLAMFKPMDKIPCRKTLGLDENKKYILFSSSFDNTVKNFGLLKQALELWGSDAPEVLELKGVRREMVPVYMNAADVCVLCSFTEGSPQFIKESMACNKPIVATNVGDIVELFGDSANCKITTFEAYDLLEKLKSLIKESESNGRSRMEQYELSKIASKTIIQYNK